MYIHSCLFIFGSRSFRKTKINKPSCQVHIIGRVGKQFIEERNEDSEGAGRGFKLVCAIRTARDDDLEFQLELKHTADKILKNQKGNRGS